MIEKDITVNNQTGLHMRPATIFVETARKFPNCDIFVKKGKIQVNGKSLIGLVKLGIEKGETITLILNGEDEEKAHSALSYILSHPNIESEYED